MGFPLVKPLVWVGVSLKDVRDFPEAVKDDVDVALYDAQRGLKSSTAKPLKRFGGASALEIVSDYRTDTYRTVYTVQFSERIYVLHAFQKKSKNGIAMPQTEVELLKSRLQQSAELHQTWQQETAKYKPEEQ